MKIFYDFQIFTNQRYGGPSRYFVDLSSAIKKLGFETKIFSEFYINEHLKEIYDQDIVVGKKIYFNRFLSKINSVKKIFKRINTVKNKKNYSAFEPDVLHLTYYNNFFGEKKKNTILTVYDLIHEIYPHYYNRNNFRPKKKILDNVDKIICISENTKNDLLNFYKVDESKIFVVHLASSLKNKYSFKKKSEVNEYKPYFLFVGNRNGYKNFNNLLQMLSQNKKLLDTFDLLCFGGGNFSLSEKLIFKKLHLPEKKIIYLEGDDNLLCKIYQNAEVFIYPSFYEGFGLPILEAFQNKCPVVCSRTSSLIEVGGDAVSYFDPHNTDSMFDSISSVLYNNELKNDLVTKGLNRLSEFNWEKTALKTIEIYKK